MNLPIRITYKENAEHFVDGFGNFPQSTKPPISPRNQNIFFAALIGGTILYALWEQYRKGADLKFLIVAPFGVILVLLFWVWFFKKIGLYRNDGPAVYQWTEKDRVRLEKRYEMKSGRTATMVVCEFDETGFRLTTPEQKTNGYEWAQVRRVVEVPAGIFVFIAKTTHMWFPKKYFASTQEYGDLLRLVEQKVPSFKSIRFEQMVFIALGANQGSSRKNVERAMNVLGSFSDIRVWKSSLWQATPVDCPPGSPMFVNAVVGFLPRADETPESLLKKMQAMEKEFGRTPKKVLNEARPLDLDIIAFANETGSAQQLVLPHPRAHERRFVLQPLAEIAPELVLPGQNKTIAQLLADLPPDGTMRKIE